jgi:uncharacterized protein
MADAKFQTGTVLLDGPAGAMEVLVDAPAGALRGIAVVAHPQPQLGGSATHKIPHLLARAIRELGWLAARPNFRGVGASQGRHDGGFGETDDVLSLVEQLRRDLPDVPLALVGFSFGAFVQSRVALRLASTRPARDVVLAGLPVGEVEGQRHYSTESVPAGTLILHGELDVVAPLSAVLRWARPQSLPVVVVPGADHFFSGRLPVLRTLVTAPLRVTALNCRRPPCQG